MICEMQSETMQSGLGRGNDEGRCRFQEMSTQAPVA